MYPIDPPLQTSAFVIQSQDYTTIGCHIPIIIPFFFSFSFSCSFRQRLCQTRKHSSRMHTVRSSNRLPGDVCPGVGVSAQREGVSAQTEGVFSPRVSAKEGCLPWWGEGCLPGGVSARKSVCPVHRMTDACENITLPQLRRGW